VPTAVEASKGVKAKYDRGDTTTAWYLEESRERATVKPAQPEPRITTRSRSAWNVRFYHTGVQVGVL
jgi:hypothetical protein